MPTSSPAAEAASAAGRGAASTATGFTLRVVDARDLSLVGAEVRRESSCVVGRVEGCDAILPDASVSRRHARVCSTPDGLLLEDLGSANGTWVGDRRVLKARLDHLDRFRVGAVMLELLRHDDAAGETLERTQAIAAPAAEVFEGLAATRRGEAPLAAEGEEVRLSGNRPFLLDDPASAWLVVEGRVDVFTVPLAEGQPAGARSHFLGVEVGSALFGMDLGESGLGWGFLVSGKTGTRLRKIPVSRLARLAADGRHVGQIAGLLEGWTASLCLALAGQEEAPHVDEELEAGRAVVLDYQKRARARRGAAWVEVLGSRLLLAGLAEIGAAGERLLVPVTRAGWVESAVDGLVLEALPPERVLARPELWRSLPAFHRAICESAFLHKRLSRVDELNRQRSRSEHAEAAQAAALRDIGGVLSAGSPEVGGANAPGDADPTFAACRVVCASLGLEATRPVEPRTEGAAGAGFEESLRGIALASRFRTRRVALRGAWWREEHGSLLGMVESTRTPVPLLQTSPSSYALVDPRSGERTPVTRDVAAGLVPFAYALYRSLPDGVLRLRDVAAFAARGLSHDLRAILAAGIGIGLLGAAVPFLVGLAFDLSILRAERGLLFQLAAAILVASTAGAAFRLTQAVATIRIQSRTDYATQAALWSRLLELPPTFFRRFTAGDLADRAFGVDAIWQLVSGAGARAALGAVSGLFFLGTLLAISVRLTLVALLLTGVLAGAMALANLLQLRSQRDQLAVRGHLTGLVIQLLSGIAKLRVSGSEAHAFRVWARGFAEQRRLAYRSGRVQCALAAFSSAYPALSSMLLFLTYTSAQAGGGGSRSLSTGAFIGFLATFGLLSAAMQALGEASLGLLQVVPLWERLTPILETPPEVDASLAAPARLAGEIELSHVWFRYSADGPWVVRDLSLRIRAGELVAFVGPSGCGKSTLLRLLLGFEKPEKGSISFDGQDLATLDLRLLRRQLGVVLQDSHVLPADLFRNIVGTSSRTMDEAWEAAEAAGLADDIREMPMGMLTFVAEGGGTLSGGQRQRLMIARALVGKPRVLFLDEATSALDNRTQALVTAGMDRLRATRITIAHRLSTVANADRILYLENGGIVESGTYAELIQANGPFAEMARRQEA